jgi:high-affinity iron transporter
VLEGLALGAVVTAIVAVAMFRLQKRLPYKKMLIYTGVMVGVVLLIMVGKTVRAMQGVGWLPITPLDVDLPFWAGLWFGIFPTLEVVIAQILAALFVIGSYFAAERMRKGGRASVSAPPATLTPASNGSAATPSANGNGNGHNPDAAGELAGSAAGAKPPD